MKIALLTILIVFWIVLPIFLTIVAISQGVLINQRRKARFTTWEGWILSPTALRNYDRLAMLLEQHQNLFKEINRLFEQTTADEWRKIKLQKMFRRAEENARIYNQLSGQTNFQFSLKDWVPDGEIALPRELPFPTQAICY